jgi:hypothetical protein
MSGNEMDNPQTYRGGVDEPDSAKGGAGDTGIVPREMVDEDTSGKTDEQEMNPEALGGLATETATEQVPRDGGDDADATHQGGQDDTRGSWAGEKANPDHGRTGDTEGH